MAHLNVSFKEAEKVVDHPSHASLVSKNRFSPLINSYEDFPELQQRANRSRVYSQSKQPEQSQPFTHNNPNKKRKVQDHSPNITPIPREYPWSFGGSPVIHTNTNNALSFEDIKSRIITELSRNISSIFQSINFPLTQNVTGIVNIEQAISKLVSEILLNYSIQSQT